MLSLLPGRRLRLPRVRGGSCRASVSAVNGGRLIAGAGPLQILCGNPNRVRTPSAKQTWSGGRSARPGNPAPASRPSSSSNTSAVRSVHGSCSLGMNNDRPQAAVCSPHRAVTKTARSSRGIEACRPTRMATRLRRRRPVAGQRVRAVQANSLAPERNPFVPTHPGRTGRADPASAGHRAPPPAGTHPGCGTPRRAGRPRPPSTAGHWFPRTCRSRAPPVRHRTRPDHPKRHQRHRGQTRGTARPAPHPAVRPAA